MIELTNELQTTGNNLADRFAQALAEAPPDFLLADDAPVAPSVSQAPLSTATAPALAPAAPLSLIPPIPPADAVPTEQPAELPGVLRQVQEVTGLLSQSTPEAAKDFLLALQGVNAPLAENLTMALREYLTDEEKALTAIPVELPPVQFDFDGFLAAKNPDEYDEQTVADFKTVTDAAKADIEQARATATYWQQRAIQAEQGAIAPAQQPPSSDFIDARAETILTAFQSIPVLASNEEAARLVHGSLMESLQTLPAFIEGRKAAKDGNQLGAYQAGLVVDQAINQFIAQAVKVIAPAAPAPAAPALAVAVPAIPVGAPARSTAIPPVTPAAGASFVDGLLANINQFEQTGAAPWMVQ